MPNANMMKEVQLLSLHGYRFEVATATVQYVTTVQRTLPATTWFTSLLHAYSSLLFTRSELFLPLICM